MPSRRAADRPAPPRRNGPPCGLGTGSPSPERRAAAGAGVARALRKAWGRARHGTLAAAAALLAAAAPPAAAFDIPPPPPAFYQDLIVPLFPDSTAVPFSGQSGGAGRNRGTRPEAPARVSTRATGRPQVEANARELAQAAPPALREHMARAYVQSFDTWRQLERKLGLPADDVAAALAAFIAGNYMAWRDVEVPDAAYLRLVEQLRAALAGNPGFARASASQRRQLYEQMAMVGTFMAVARLSFRQQPNPPAEQNFREAAAANLEAALKVPAAQVRITDQGLKLR